MKGSKELKVRADLSDIERVRGFLRDKIRELSVGEDDALKMELSLHEICVNIAMYAYPQGKGDLKVRIWQDNGTVFLEVRDNGIPFNPADKSDPDLEETIRQGKRGGLGIFLYKTLMDGFSYKRENAENILTIFKKT